jgi:hypothetical protein
MIPVQQTIFGPPHGDCYRACVASILELPIDDVPNFVESGDKWIEATEDFLLKFRLQPITLMVDHCRDAGLIPAGYHIIGGKSPRGDFYHAVVGFKGNRVYDPHPDELGLRTEETWTVFSDTMEYPVYREILQAMKSSIDRQM